jgi:hypothetical protein
VALAGKAAAIYDAAAGRVPVVLAEWVKRSPELSENHMIEGRVQWGFSGPPERPRTP